MELRTAREVLEGIDLTGKTAIVTGSAGLGFETARALALSGCEVIIGARSIEAAEKAASSIKAEGARNKVSVKVKYLDLASIETIKQFTWDIISNYKKIDFVVCNAGVMATPKSVTSDGFELQFGTNYVGHVVLINGLLPLLRTQGHPARIVIVSSLSHKWGKIVLDDLNFENRRYNPWVSYSQSKLACLLYAKELARRLESEKITHIKVVALHPGIILGTNLTKQKTSCIRSCMKPLLLACVKPWTRSPEEGAATSVYACVSEDVKTGDYLENCGVSTASKSAMDIDMAAKLYEKTEQMFAEVEKKKKSTNT